MMMDSLGMCAANNVSFGNNDDDAMNYPTDNYQSNSVNQNQAEPIRGGIEVAQTSNAKATTLASGQLFAQNDGQPIAKMCRIECFSAAHRLHNPNLNAEHNQQIYGKCNNKNGHGHNYRWKVVLEGPVNAQTGMVKVKLCIL